MSGRCPVCDTQLVEQGSSWLRKDRETDPCVGQCQEIADLRVENERLREDHKESMLAHDKTIAIYQEREAEVDRAWEAAKSWWEAAKYWEKSCLTAKDEVERLREACRQWSRGEIVRNKLAEDE